MKLKNEVKLLIIPHILEASVWFTSSLGGVLLGTAIGRLASGYEALSSILLGLLFIAICAVLTAYRVIWMLNRRKDVKIKIRKRRTNRQIELDKKGLEEATKTS